MAYMKWIKTIKDAAQIQMEQGMLGVLAAKTNIPEGRLRTWLENKTIDQLSHGELMDLHRALAPVEDQSNVISETEKQRAEEIAKHSAERRCYSHSDHIVSFDESD